MQPTTIGLLGVAGMVVLLFLHFPVGVALALAGIATFWALRDLPSALSLLSTEPVSVLQDGEVGVIPLFLLMGGFAMQSGLSADLYRLGYAVFGRLRGGLAMATIGACAGFGAICGSSIATVATMTKVALPEMLGRGYSRELAAGSIAAGGTLGFLIPPSIVFIVYGYLTEQSVVKLFAAAILPGVLAVTLDLLAIIATVRLRPAAAPAAAQVPWFEIVSAFRAALAAIAIAALVLGGIYGGVFSVSEAAAVGAASTFLHALWRRRLDRASFFGVLLDAGANTAMIYFVLIGAALFNYAMALSGLPEVSVAAIQGAQIEGWMVIVALVLFYIAIGCLFESVSAMVLTVPFVFPLVIGFGYDPIWWGVVMCMVIELGMITPPVGLNVFVLHGMAPEIRLGTIFRGVVPFILADAVRIGLLIAFPSIALVLLR